MPGRIALGMPFKSISDQTASDAWHNDQAEINKQLFVNSTIEATIRSFKKSNKDSLKLDYNHTLAGQQIPKDKDLVIYTTYNQILNLSHEDMATFDYVVIDECHTFSDGLNYRAELIAKLINYLIEFVAKKKKLKTKIIFMTGTPNVEALVIPELMETQSIKNLFQIIKIEKKYKKEPKIYLTHLDTSSSKKRKDTVISEINRYLREGRKVLHIFNNKDKMDEYRRDIQSKLSPSIKVGLFYSGSKGECTENILSGKFGDFDVVLATTYFMNGININLDKITKFDFSNGVTSSQKYGVVIDLGNMHTRVSALDAVQTINRFRNRLCNCTVFLPQIFKPDENNTSRKFDYRNAGKVLLGINKYNFHLLSVNKNRKANPLEDITQKQKIHYLNEIRKDPSKITLYMIEKRMQQSKDENAVINSINKEISIYEDWLYSLDGYHYMAQDAGMLSIIKHKEVSEPLKDISSEHLILENKVIENFLNDDAALDYLEHQIDPSKRVFVKSSGKITDPMCTKVENLEAVDFINDKYVIEGDFHISHERAINKIMNLHLKLLYWYGADKAIKILRYLINENANFVPFKHISYLKSVSNYVYPFSCLLREKYQKAIKYLIGLDYLSEKNVGITKEVAATHISFTFINDEVVSQLKNMWAKQQFDKTHYAINNSYSSKYKDDLKKEFSDELLIRETDLEDLEDQLSKLTFYKPMRKNKNGELTRHERIIIPRFLICDKLLSEMNLMDNDSVEPEYSDLSDFNIEFENFTNKILKRLDDYLNPSIRLKHIHLENIYNSLKVKLEKRDILVSVEYIEGILNDPSKNTLPNVSEILNSLKKDLKELDRCLLSAFKTAEHLTYKNLHVYKTFPFIEKSFFCDKDFMLETLYSKFSPDLINFNITDIYDSLFTHTDLFTKAKTIKVRTELGREIININNNNPSSYTKPVHVVSDKNGKIIYANFDQKATCVFLCNYAFNNERFKMKDKSIPIKTINKGIYNPITFKRDYYDNSSEAKTVSNYNINIYNVNIKEYVNHVKSKNSKKAS